MNWLEVFLLGILQGITEFLPVSSSAHLALFQHLLGFQEPQMLFDLCLHLGSVGTVIWFFGPLLWRLTRDFFRWIAAIFTGKAMDTGIRQSMWLMLMLGVSTLCTAVFGVTLARYTRELSLAVVGVLLILNGLILMVNHPRLLKNAPTISMDAMPIRSAIIIGVIQGIAACFRGISRSGTTITTGRILGLSVQDAMDFSFLLLIPAVLGGVFLELRHATPAWEMAPQFMVGGLVAMLTGFALLRFLLWLLRTERFFWFGPYCFIVGVLALAL